MIGATLPTMAIATIERPDDLVEVADVVVLAVPTHRFGELPPDLFAGKVLVDATNYWQPVYGDDPELTGAAGGTTTVVQARFSSARVVESLNRPATTSSKRTCAPTEHPASSCSGVSAAIVRPRVGSLGRVPKRREGADSLVSHDRTGDRAICVFGAATTQLTHLTMRVCAAPLTPELPGLDSDRPANR
jgi:hypothetical protein